MPHSFTQLLFELSLILTAAKLGGLAARKLHLPVVLGELFAGIVLGEALRNDPSLVTLAELGVILLMFEVGVESTVPKLMAVGRSALMVAIIGVIAPFLLGLATIRIFFPYFSLWVDVFLGATLCATSVGISARVLKDLGKVQTQEGRTILAAAVVDDVVAAIISSPQGQASAGIGIEIVVISAKAFGFLAFGIILGVTFSKKLYRWAARLELSGMLLTLSLTLCFAFAYLSRRFGLAPLVGAFAAGLILEPEHSLIFKSQERDRLEHLLLPLSTLFVPIFFLHMGMQVDLKALFSVKAIVVGLVLSAAAVVGKMACAGGVFSGNERLDRWTVALGMVPRGEVGLIFAGLGSQLRVNGQPLLEPALYAAIIVMVFITTAMTPPLLSHRLSGSMRNDDYSFPPLNR
jgi:Kef-type K+ transport system membrane component KefB